ncbi:ABC transporter ATP-binding protein [Lyngbya confervoides]|uniref:ABC transporter ATP-binding protein/permease n=1 Tax=Lyngbya confervoides BDU141951 TaxID=1574623 RepID=A0ABD4T0X5_9CYAN|nr:ABC transporter ATP-binding protein [Lyngbya confervoides]MCM1982078.1 ABC transporter ATP-binding protein/permease [Lyngbya confervoides BDU141951]
MPSSSTASSRQASRRSHPLWRLAAYGRPYRRQFWLASLCSVLNKIFDLAPPVLIGTAVDIVVQRQDSILGRLGLADVTQQLLVLGGLSLVIWGLESVFEYAYARLWRNLAQTVQHHLRLDAYAHLQNLDLAFFEDQSTGGLMSILSDDINQLERFLDGGANELLHLLTTIVVIGGAFFILSPQVAWMAVLPMPFIIWGAIAFQKLLAPRYARVREAVSLLNGRLSNNLSGITTIKSFVAEDYEREQVRRESEVYRQANHQAIALSAAFIPVIRILILLAFVAAIILGGQEVIAERLAVGTYSVMIFLTQRLLWPLTRMGDTLDHYQRAMASITRCMNLLDTPITIHPGHQSLPFSAVRGEVNLDHVSFAYASGQSVIHDLSLRIPAGATIAIVGATGSGKSTLVKLLLRLYEIQSGVITLDGVDIQSYRLPDLRRAIGLVSQEVFLFHGTVRENIAYGSFNASMEEVQAAARNAEAHAFIEQLPHGYDTMIGERGQKLSGGQRQRIAIARALLKNPPILILDEATSAVDNETEAAIQRSLDRITQNRTTLAIAHRLSTIRHADCIYVMDQGRLVEQGQHEALLAQQGLYAQLWQVQTGLRSLASR